VIHPRFDNSSAMSRTEQEGDWLDGRLHSLSVGLEDVEDIKEDLDQALRKAAENG